jgi:predicted MFS family arabinose efflux permease
MKRNPLNTIPAFTSYQKFVAAVLSFLNFTVILDFMILSPMAAILMPALKISTSQFGVVVSAYAFGAGISGVLTASFADRFDRRKILLLFYFGFILGTFLCGVATNYRFLLGARIVTGAFGGVMASIIMAIVTDLFPYELRGRVMGFVQASFAASQILGIPLAIWLSNHWGWHAPFLFIVATSLVVLVPTLFRLEPIDNHIMAAHDRSILNHFLKMISNTMYLYAFLTITLLSVGSFMFMPFVSAFTVNNLRISVNSLPIVYLAADICSIVAGIMAGRLSDSIGKFPVFLSGTILSVTLVAVYVGLDVTPLFLVLIVNSLLFVGVSSKMVSERALMSTIPGQSDRGWFMSIGSSVQQISGGVGAMVAGFIVTERADGALQHFDTVGFLVIAANLITLAMMYTINKVVSKEMKGSQTVSAGKL